jgi:hypothetical protein
MISQIAREKGKLYNIENRERISARNKLYYQKNKEIRQRRRKEHYNLNKEAILKHGREYYTRDDIRKKQRDRYKNDITYRLAQKFRATLNDCIRKGKATKHNKVLHLLGCSIEKVRLHIETLWLPGMNWDNNTHTGWHIDHIKPINMFDLNDPEQQKICFHYTNLRPLWWVDNLSRPKDGSDTVL